MRATIGLLIALTLLGGQAPWTGHVPDRIFAVKREIEAARPGARLDAMTVPLLLNQNGTVVSVPEPK